MATSFITEENFKNLDSTLLLDAKWYPQMEEMVLSIDTAYTPDYSKQYALLLQAKLIPVFNSLPKDLQDKYLRLLKVLLLGSLLAMTDADKERFVRESILDTFRVSFVSVRNWVEHVFRSNRGADDLIKRYRELFLRALANNRELLGTESIKMPGEDTPQPPSVKNWLSDYAAFLSKTPTKSAVVGRVETGKYLTTSPNVQKLPAQERDVLLKLLELYDWLQYGQLKFDFSFPGQQVPDKMLEGNEHTLIPRELVDLINKFRAEKNSKLAATPTPALSRPVTSTPPKSTDGFKPFTPLEPVARRDFKIAPSARPASSAGRPAPASPSATSQLLKPAMDVKKQTASGAGAAAESSKAFSVSGASLLNMSLSQAIANADLGALPAGGNIRVGKQEPAPVSPAGGPPLPPKPPASSAGRPVLSSQGGQERVRSVIPGRIVPAEISPSKLVSAQPVAPQSPSSLPASPAGGPNPPHPSSATATADSQGEGKSNVVDLTRRQPLQITSIRSVEELQKIELADADGMRFDARLQQIKQRIIELSREYQMPIKQVAAYFYRSPFYTLYMTMGVAVMNDTSSGDQKAAFEKIVKNYQAAGKQYLTREQFLAINNLKKELAGLEVNI